MRGGPGSADRLVLFGVYLGLLVWGGLFLRDDRIRALVLRS
jgi:hypothetical protein